MKWWKRLKISTVIFSLCRSTDYTQHLVCVPSFRTAEVSWQQSRDSHGPLMISEGTFSSPQGTARDCLKTFLHSPAWSSFLHPALSSSPAESIRPFDSTHVEHPNFLHLCLCLLFVFSCGRYVEHDPQARWPGWTWCRMFIHMHWNSYTYTFKTAVIRKWAMKCVSGGTLIICFIA